MYFADCKKYSLFLNLTPYFHNCKKLLLSFEFYPLFSRAGGKLLFWKDPSEGSANIYISLSIIKLKRQFFRTDPRIEPKFGTQVRIDTITLIG